MSEPQIGADQERVYCRGREGCKASAVDQAQRFTYPYICLECWLAGWRWNPVAKTTYQEPPISKG